mmetsp:Transcript_12669/g.20630  ORF Transcript_12669/g.20630 Transcript_12669/m.20630 type:complete len:220 (-) Transcript_12669:792-1451(-)
MQPRPRLPLTMHPPFPPLETPVILLPLRIWHASNSYPLVSRPPLPPHAFHMYPCPCPLNPTPRPPLEPPPPPPPQHPMPLPLPRPSRPAKVPSLQSLLCPTRTPAQHRVQVPCLHPPPRHPFRPQGGGHPPPDQPSCPLCPLHLWACSPTRFQKVRLRLPWPFCPQAIPRPLRLRHLQMLFPILAPLCCRYPIQQTATRLSGRPLDPCPALPPLHHASL